MGRTLQNHRSRFLARLAVLRLILFFVVLVVADIGAQLGLQQFVRHVPPHHQELVTLAAALAACLVMLLVYVLLVRWIERRPAKELAPLRGLPLAAAGAILGFALFCAVYGVLWVLGVAHWRGFSGFHGVPLALLPALLAAVGEELAIRGGVFRILEDSLGTLFALLLSAGLFGLLHALNRGATPVSTAAIALEAGVLLGAAYALTRNLWFPIGLHFGWNFTEGGVFGAAVSGGGGGHGMVLVPLGGPDLLTGGVFGPEASIVAVAVCLAAALILLILTVRRRHWVPMSFNMMLD